MSTQLVPVYTALGIQRNKRLQNLRINRSSYLLVLLLSDSNGVHGALPIIFGSHIPHSLSIIILDLSRRNQSLRLPPEDTHLSMLPKTLSEVARNLLQALLKFGDILSINFSVQGSCFRRSGTHRLSSTSSTKSHKFFTELRPDSLSFIGYRKPIIKLSINLLLLFRRKIRLFNGGSNIRSIVYLCRLEHLLLEILKVFSFSYPEKAEDTTTKNSSYGYVGSIIVVPSGIRSRSGYTAYGTHSTVSSSSSKRTQAINSLEQLRYLAYLTNCTQSIGRIEYSASQGGQSMTIPCRLSRLFIHGSSGEPLSILRREYHSVVFVFVFISITPKQSLHLTPIFLLRSISPLLVEYVRLRYTVINTRQSLIVHPSSLYRLQRSHGRFSHLRPKRIQRSRLVLSRFRYCRVYATYVHNTLWSRRRDLIYHYISLSMALNCRRPATRYFCLED